MTLDDENVRELVNVGNALYRLYLVDVAWFTNYRIFDEMTDDNRYRWWERAKKQAALGAPGMQILLSKVIELRLTS